MKIINSFTNTDKSDRNSELMGYPYHDPSLCCSIQLGQYDASDTQGLMKHLSLRDGILASGCIKYKPYMMGGTWKFTIGDTMDFLQFVHKVSLGMHAAGCIDKENIYLS